jgi:LPS-assembly lipoprotein
MPVLKRAQRAWVANAGGKLRLADAKIHARVGLVVIAALAIGLSGCGSSGFQPLYATGSNGERAEDRLAQLDIAPIPGRVGQSIRNELLFDKSGATGGQPATKRVEIKLTESIFTTLADTKGDSAGQTYQVEAVYRIVNLETSKVETEGRSVARANFERFQSIYSNIRGRENAESQAARVIARDLKTRLAVHMSRS